MAFLAGTASNPEDAEEIQILRHSHHEGAWYFNAPGTGRVHLSWRNTFKLNSPRVILADWRIEDADTGARAAAAVPGVPMPEPTVSLSDRLASRFSFLGSSPQAAQAPAPVVEWTLDD